MNHEPFDGTLTIRDEGGKEFRYLCHPMDTEYLVAPGDSVLEGMLPPEEFEVRSALMDFKFWSDAYGRLGVLPRMMNTQKAKQCQAALIDATQRLHDMVNTSPQHMASLKRIVNAMPQRNGGREALVPFVRDN